MARKGKEEMLRDEIRAARLEVIRRRHWELVLQPREMLAANLEDDFGHPFEDVAESDEMALVGAGIDRF
jgi:hypothetical protein